MHLRPLACLALLAVLALAGCGDLPEPFLGNPGAAARKLAQPLTPLLAVTAGSDTLLPDAANRELTESVAKALQKSEVPAIARSPGKTDWRLVTRAEQRGETIVPKFVVEDPQGKDEGSAEGDAVPIAAWSVADPAMLRQTADEAAPKISAVLTSIQIARNRADPNSLYNRAAKVMVAEVTGAPGDGNQSLTKQMRARLALLGPIVQTTPDSADFIVQGQVKAVPVAAHQERIEIQWIVKAGSGDERGRVVQLNEVPAGTLDHYWGDVAVVVATEASGGVNDVIERQAGRDPHVAETATPDKAANAKPADTKSS
ncbi:MAG TPA: hypothetical protein VIG49_12895, partial [Acetobacteraceae bacterium]